MTLFQALILGIVQGITEFLPISSSGHLRIFKHLLGVSDGEHLLYFDLLCHAGTLLALVFYLRKEIWDVLRDFRKISLFTVALLPLVPGYFLLKPLRIALSDPSYLGYFLMVTSLLLFSATRQKSFNFATDAPFSDASDVEVASKRKKWSSVLFIGIMQTLALIPGISRSGATITAARFCGWDWKAAARFSFLLAVPTIFGGEVLETMKIIKGNFEAYTELPMLCYGIGFLTSFCVGTIAIRQMFKIYEKGTIRPFAWYCLIIGILSLAMFHG